MLLRHFLFDVPFLPFFWDSCLLFPTYHYHYHYLPHTYLWTNCTLYPCFLALRPKMAPKKQKQKKHSLVHPLILISLHSHSRLQARGLMWRSPIYLLLDTWTRKTKNTQGVIQWKGWLLRLTHIRRRCVDKSCYRRGTCQFGVCVQPSPWQNNIKRAKIAKENTKTK